MGGSAKTEAGLTWISRSPLGVLLSENLRLAITRRDRYYMYVSVCLCLYSVVWKCWFLEFKSFTV